MLVTWKYRERDSLFQRFDPRARLIFFLAVMFSVIQFWDLRIIVLFLALALGQFLLAKLTWQETRRTWRLISLVILFMTVLTFLTGRGGAGSSVLQEEHLIHRLGPVSLPLVGWQLKLDITLEKTIFAISQMVRMFVITTLAISIPYTTDPRLYGVMFRGLGLPDKFAFAMDLAFRFVPTLARDFSITLDSQRARGYEVEKLEGGIITQIRKLAPLLVPVTINAIVSSEDIIDAMDLRCFAVGPRTWVYKLHYRRADWLLIAFSLFLFASSIALSVLQIGQLWVPSVLRVWVGT